MKYLILITSLFLALTIDAQVKHDLESWTGVKTDVKLHKHFEIKIDAQLRRNDFLSQRKSALVEIGLAYDPFKWLTFTPAYRFTHKDNSRSYGRLSMDMELEFDLGKDWSIENRSRAQYEYRYATVNRETELRNKTQLDYNLSKLFDPYTSVEFFYGNGNFSDYRLRIGGSWRLSKKIDLNTFYSMESEMGKKTNDKDHIVGLFLKINLDARKKKRK
tara:strand:+ start:42341 stop:42991 length:651 start_codon:yes stop_codon:yes gene_type:complete